MVGEQKGVWPGPRRLLQQNLLFTPRLVPVKSHSGLERRLGEAGYSQLFTKTGVLFLFCLLSVAVIHTVTTDNLGRCGFIWPHVLITVHY